MQLICVCVCVCVCVRARARACVREKVSEFEGLFGGELVAATVACMYMQLMYVSVYVRVCASACV